MGEKLVSVDPPSFVLQLLKVNFSEGGRVRREAVQMSTTTNAQQPDPAGTKALLASLESVVMDLNDMENMIENFEEPAAESFYSKV